MRNYEAVKFRRCEVMTQDVNPRSCEAVKL